MRKIILNKDILKFSLLEFISWALMGCFISFLVMYLKEKSFSSRHIGIAMSLGSVAGMAGQFLLGYLCDTFKTIKKILLVCIVILPVISLIIPLVEQAYVLIIITCAISFVRMPMPVILDSWVLLYSEQTRRHYGLIRGGGSVGFAVFSVILGLLIEWYNWDILFKSIIVLSSLYALGVLFNQDIKHIKEKQDSPKKNPLSLLKNPHYLFFALFTFLLFVPLFMIIVYLSAIFEATGGGSSYVGAALFINAISEAPIMFLYIRMNKKINANRLLFIAALFFLVRYVWLFFADTNLQIVLTFVLQSFSFGLLIPATRNIIYSISPKGLKTSSQSMFDAFAMGGSGILGSFLGGFILDIYNVKVLLGICVGSTFIAVLMILVYNIKNR
ncbi:MAG: MFS transporter [Spirochaetes bacterium]|nr:MFS transporter [Spirochaetota bacterium]